MSFNSSAAFRYAAVVLSTAVALGVTALLKCWRVPGTYPPFLANVVFASWIAGFGGAMLSIVLSVTTIQYFFLSPIYSLALQGSSAISLAVFVAVSVGTALVSLRVTGTSGLLAAALGSLQDGVIVSDLGGRVTYLNRIAERLTGWRVEQAERHRVAEVFRVVEPGASAAEEPVTPVLASGREQLLEPFRFLLAPDGERIPVEGAVAPIRDGAGRRRGAIVLFRDVRERQRMLENLQRTSETLRAILENTPLAVWAVNLEGRVTFWNPAAEHIFGWREPEVRGAQLPVIPEDQRLEFEEMLTHYKSGEGLSGVERQRQKRDGSLIWTRIWAVPLRNEIGLVTGTLGVVMDTTEEKKVQDKLLQSGDRLAWAQAIARLGSWERAASSDTLEWSEETYRIFGLEPGQPITLETFFQAVHPEDREKVRATVREAFKTGTAYELEHRIIRPDGKLRWVREEAKVMTAVPVGRPICLLGTVQDITERKQLEEQLRQAQKMEAIGQLAGGVAHDFNNLLTVILGYGNLLVEQCRSQAGSRELVEEILKAAERAAALTGQLLAFSRRQVLQPRTLSLNASVEQIQPMLHRLLGEDIDLVSHLNPQLWNVSADPGQIDQIIMNLVVNARDAMPRGGKLTIETANAAIDAVYASEHLGVEPGRYVLLAISDTGCGMDAATQARLFEPFFTTKDKGTGLGLSTVYGIVKQNGGSIWVYSEPQRGTTFKIYLPAAEGAATIETKKEVPAEGPIHGGRILLVEDEPAVRRLTAQVLRQGGYDVLEAGTAEEAIATCETRPAPVDLMITDLVLPQMDGIALAQEVMQRHPHIRVIYSSGYTEHAVLRQGVFETAAVFLQKPFTPAALLETVKECLHPDGGALGAQG